MSSGATTLHDLRCSHRNENVAELAIEITNTIINPRRRHEIVVVPVVPPELSARGKAVASVLVTSWQTHMLRVTVSIAVVPPELSARGKVVASVLVILGRPTCSTRHRIHRGGYE